jgi:hypothetical protein
VRLTLPNDTAFEAETMVAIDSYCKFAKECLPKP